MLYNYTNPVDNGMDLLGGHIMRKKLGHIVRRPGLKNGDSEIEIPVAADLLSQPGIPTNQHDLDYYATRYPLETQGITNTATDTEWMWTVIQPEQESDIREHGELMTPVVKAARAQGELEPTIEASPGKDVTTDIKSKARDLGFGEIGITRYDRRYTYKSKKKWVKYEHAICLAFEQDYLRTQTIPSSYGEWAHHSTYRTMGQAALILADYIRDLGYHAQVHTAGNDASAPYIPMFVDAGLGQLGANGQLLSPHFGSRARLMVITTDALVTYDEPIDYGMHKFCQICQVCVDRCPGRALMRDKIWWRGVEKNKLVYERCRPVIARFAGCAICMKVCPVQKYGMKPVMEHYIDTGEVLGKGTHELEGYKLEDKGYFGPGKLPNFNKAFFQFPQGRSEDVLFEEFKKKVKNGQIADSPDGDEQLREFRRRISKILVAPTDELDNVPK